MKSLEGSESPITITNTSGLPPRSQNQDARGLAQTTRIDSPVVHGGVVRVRYDPSLVSARQPRHGCLKLGRGMCLLLPPVRYRATPILGQPLRSEARKANPLPAASCSQRHEAGPLQSRRTSCQKLPEI